MGMIGNSLAQGLISGANIQDGTVDTPDIKDGAIHTAKVADDAVHTAKIADGAVTSDKLADSVAVSDLSSSGYIRVDSASGGQSYLTLKDNGYTADYIQMRDSANGLDNLFSAGGGVVLNEQGKDVDFRVESDGNSNMLFVDAGSDAVYFGKNTYSNDVNAAGHIFFAAGKTIHTSSSAQCLVLANSQTSGDAYPIEFYYGGSVKGRVKTTVSGTTYLTSSDRRLKDNIEPIADGTEKLMVMKPVTHTWKDIPMSSTVHGFIAQEMQEIVPEAVSGDPDGEEMMSMDYGRITPVLVAALQDAHKKIAELEARLNTLEDK